MDLDVYLADDRREYLDAVQHDGINLLPGSHTDLLPLLPFDTRSYIAIMTYSHPMDREILAYCLKKPFAYLGMIGSQRKVELTRKMFLEGGICTAEELARADMPLGLDIGGISPAQACYWLIATMASGPTSSTRPHPVRPWMIRSRPGHSTRRSVTYFRNATRCSSVLT